MRSKVVIVEGPIGAGKSSFSADLGECLGENTLLLSEPDERQGGNPYLAAYYADPKRWAFTLQSHMLIARLNQQRLAQQHVMNGMGNAVLDRSFYGDTAFAHLQFQQGYMSETEFNTYTAAYRSMTSSVLLPAICIHLLVSPETSLARIQKRSAERPTRKFESAISIDYLRALNQEIEHMIRVLRNQGVRVIEVPWDEDRPSPADRKNAAAIIADKIHGATSMDFFDITNEMLLAHRRYAIEGEPVKAQGLHRPE